MTPIFYPSKTAYLRARVVDKDIKKRVVNANLERLEHTLVNSNEELNKLGVNINQIARHLNTYRVRSTKVRYFPCSNCSCPPKK